jgi:hypothetical protein
MDFLYVVKLVAESDGVINNLVCQQVTKFFESELENEKKAVDVGV